MESAKKVKDELFKQFAEAASQSGQGYLGAGDTSKFEPGIAGFGEVN